MSAETETIDALLERYLTLLDTYTQLRASLNTLQAAMYQHLARANFSADRGIRYYGQDYYDERTQATRRISIVASNEDITTPVFTVRGPEPEPEPEPVTEAENTDDGSEKEQDPKEETEKDSSSQPTTTTPTTKRTDEKKPNSTDPLRWFGILTPLPLRQAQSSAINAVEDIIPELASVSAEMALVELEVRRARKRRAKAERGEEKKKRVAELEKQTRGSEVNKNEEKQVVASIS